MAGGGMMQISDKELDFIVSFEGKLKKRREGIDALRMARVRHDDDPDAQSRVDRAFGSFARQ